MVNSAKRPRHIAIIMDGNGRWAKERHLPRVAGHKAGLSAVRDIIESCREASIDVLSLFAFSRENWLRPKEEVGALMHLLLQALEREIKDLHQRNIRLSFIGERDTLAAPLMLKMQEAECLTRANTSLHVVAAVNYSGQWELLEAARRLAAQVEAGEMSSQDIKEEHFQRALALPELPAIDLFIRTGDERRISNFFLWQLAYAELYFTSKYWPDFNRAAFSDALAWFASRQRRFGLLNEQHTENV